MDFFLSVVVRSLYFGGDAFFEREVACAARRHDAQMLSIGSRDKN